MALYRYTRSDDRRVAGVLGLPRAMAQHHHRCCSAAVVVGGEQPAGKRPDAEGHEVVAAHELAAQRLRNAFHALAPHAVAVAAGLEGGELGELRGRVFQPLEKRIRKHAPLVLRSPLDAAVVCRSDPVKRSRIDHRQRSQHDRVDEREDGRRAANADGQGQEHGGREHRSGPELPERVANVTELKGHD